ncbi:MAG: hypothetical protein ACI9MR_001637, partial [Myxococcota bacterium]
MVSTAVSLEALAGMPFPQQITSIDAHVAAGGDAGALLRTLAGFPDHEPLAHAVRAFARLGRFAETDLPVALRDALQALPDTGIQRLLRGFDRAAVPTEALSVVASVVAEALGALTVERLAAVCLMDRWLKNADRPRRDNICVEAFETCRSALEAGSEDALADRVLLRIPGSRYAELRDLAGQHGRTAPWRVRLEGFAAQVIAILREAPRSLSLANAEELLSRRVYTDPGHFLVELLQNAEDAGARTFTVEVYPNEVRIWHDGVPFDAKDVVGVLSIGQTTKSRDQIGFFGVGFKSVYEICERPQVYSELFNFEIADISIPRALANRPSDAQATAGTLLVLPYRQPLHPEHAPEALYAKALAVPPETLLTLANLRRMELRFGAHARSVVRRDPGPGRVDLEILETDEVRRYLVGAAHVSYDGRQRELSRTMATGILVAVALDEGGAPKPLPPAAPTIFSHLPTGERSGLRFLVHAHFEVPLDRERLDLESPWNRWALGQAGELLAGMAERLSADSGQDKLDALLDVLPLPEEVRAPAYQDIVDVLRVRLAGLALLPAAAGHRLEPTEARILEEPALARALAEAHLDPAGGRACAPLEPRRARVALALGARRFEVTDLVALLRATLAETRDGDGWPTEWLSKGIGAIVDALGGHADTLDLSVLGPLAMWPGHHPHGHHEAAWSQATIRRTSPTLRELYGPARAFLDARLDDAPTLRQATLLRAMGLVRHEARDLVADLHDADMAAAIVAHCGALALHTHLAELGRSLTAGVG